LRDREVSAKTGQGEELPWGKKRPFTKKWSLKNQGIFSVGLVTSQSAAESAGAEPALAVLAVATSALAEAAPRGRGIFQTGSNAPRRLTAQVPVNHKTTHIARAATERTIS